jgi:hypothetical protein
MSDYEMTPADPTAEEQDLAVYLCQASGDDPAGGRWKLFLGQARMFIAFRAWEAEQD